MPHVVCCGVGSWASTQMIPPVMRARHAETGVWETLTRDDTAWDYLRDVTRCYYNADLDEDAYHVDLSDYDRFEGVG
jgi:hypothetical protein